MYSLHGIETAFDVLAYTLGAMKEVGFSSSDTEEYMIDAISADNYHLLESSLDRISSCNMYAKDQPSFDDTWRDYYYQSMYDKEDKENDISYCDDYFDDDFQQYEGYSTNDDIDDCLDCNGYSEDDVNNLYNKWSLDDYYASLTKDIDDYN